MNLISNRPPNTCVVGTLGWDHIPWQDVYYPSDLPAEWRLSFYANEFTGVLVPESLWRYLDDDSVFAWRDEVPTGFGFYFESRDSKNEAYETALDDAFAGWVTPPDSKSPGLLHAAYLETHRSSEPDVVLLRSTDFEDRRQLGQQLVALARQAKPPRGLFVTDAAHPSLVSELRILAEIAGLA